MELPNVVRIAGQRVFHGEFSSDRIIAYQRLCNNYRSLKPIPRD
jgi:hypothetical protein